MQGRLQDLATVCFMTNQLPVRRHACRYSSAVHACGVKSVCGCRQVLIFSGVCHDWRHSTSPRVKGIASWGPGSLTGCVVQAMRSMMPSLCAMGAGTEALRSTAPACSCSVTTSRALQA